MWAQLRTLRKRLSATAAIHQFGSHRLTMQQRRYSVNGQQLNLRFEGFTFTFSHPPTDVSMSVLPNRLGARFTLQG